MQQGAALFDTNTENLVQASRHAQRSIAFLMGAAVLLVAYICAGFLANALESDAWRGIQDLIALFAGPFILLALADAYAGRKALGRSTDRFAMVTTMVRFELLPSLGGDPLQQLTNKLDDIYPSLAYQRATGTGQFNRLRIRTDGFVWDLVANLNRGRSLDPSYVMALRFPGPGPFGLGDMSTLSKDLWRFRLQHPFSEIAAVYVVSPQGFEPSFVEDAEGGQFKDLSRYNVRLIHETGSGYRVLSE